MIDPRYVTKYDRTDNELEEWWLFCLVVAGKNAMTQSKLLDGMLNACAGNSPFDKVKMLVDRGELMEMIKLSRLGQYTKLTKAFEQSLALKGKLSTCTVDELEAIHGVGPKTARFFLLHSRPGQNIAVLDTHVLHYMRDQGIDAPKGTPGKGVKYSTLENKFIEMANGSGMSIADFDLMIWRKYSGNH